MLIGNQYRSTEPTYIGPSRDGRASRYDITCPCCGHVWEPVTTVATSELLDCPDCRAEMVVDYTHQEVDLLKPGYGL